MAMAYAWRKLWDMSNTKRRTTSHTCALCARSGVRGFYQHSVTKEWLCEDGMACAKRRGWTAPEGDFRVQIEALRVWESERATSAESED
ncbi:hypothetical protein PBI_CJW1_140 [Mycobacterium phage Cjw1]|uniref:Uncharacterized protein n=2 Tax=Kostyavirus TaxID=1623284 RepID=Q857M2_9CAUD|nr:gp142 [Mycobacterium phage Cjw1]AAN01754.1 hypothetical protein PBI_CJW1_140 [Mycobacterium phage Cjw1]